MIGKIVREVKTNINRAIVHSTIIVSSDFEHTICRMSANVEISIVTESTLLYIGTRNLENVFSRKEYSFQTLYYPISTVITF